MLFLGLHSGRSLDVQDRLRSLGTSIGALQNTARFCLAGAVPASSSRTCSTSPSLPSRTTPASQTALARLRGGRNRNHATGEHVSVRLMRPRKGSPQWDSSRCPVADSDLATDDFAHRRAEVSGLSPQSARVVGRPGAVACGAWQNRGMEPRISLITLGVADLERSLRFYRDGLGLPTTRRAEDGIAFFQTTGATLALFPYAELARDVGEGWKTPVEVHRHHLSAQRSRTTRGRRTTGPRRPRGRRGGQDRRRDGLGWLRRLLHRPRRLPVGSGMGCVRI